MSDLPSNPRLVALRCQIDEVDAGIIDLLARRFALTRQVGMVKRDTGLGPVDPEREKTMYERIRSRGASVDLDTDLLEQLYRIIIASVVSEHRALASGLADDSGTPFHEHENPQ